MPAHEIDLSTLPPKVADLLRLILNTKRVRLPSGVTAVSKSGDKISFVGPNADQIAQAVADLDVPDPATDPDPDPAPDPDPVPDPDPTPPPVTTLTAGWGWNVDEPSDWRTSIVFADRMRHARDWVRSADWGTPQSTSFDADGWPLAVTDEPLHSLLAIDLPAGSYPSGQHVCLFEGDGDIQFTTVGNTAFNQSSPSAGRINFTVPDPTQGILCKLTRSNAANPVKNIRVFMPGTTQGDTFHPDYVARTVGSEVLRYMDWGDTNNSNQVTWANRASPTKYNQNTVAYEYMIEFSNLVGADPWICIPHAADDTYITNLATLIAANLDAERKVYVEYSNEIWNGAFSGQHNYVQTIGVTQGLDQIEPDVGNAFWAGMKYQARRSAQIFEIFHSVLGASRVVRVIGSQSSNDFIGGRLLSFLADATINPTAQRADALAIAPYFGHGVKSADAGATLDALEATAAATVTSDTTANKTRADVHGVVLIAYEGGQHLTADGEDAVELAQTAANRDPRMQAIISDSLAAWKAAGGGLFCYYSLVSKPGASGYWGALEDVYTDSPKWLGTLAYRATL